MDSLDYPGLEAVFLLVAILVAYFFPSIVAKYRRNPDRVAVFVLNLFLGWTFLGWVISLAWACAGESRRT